MRRAWPIYLLLICLLAAFAGLAGISRHPDWPPLDRVATWPLIGLVVDDLRQRYRPSPPAPPRPAEPTTPVEVVHQIEPPTIGATVGALPRERIRPGAIIRKRPEPEAEALVVLRRTASFAIRERQGLWGRVRVGNEDGIAEDGWVYLSERNIDREPPLGRDPAPVTALGSGRPPTPEQLQLAVDSFSAPTTETLVGPYRLITDVGDAELLVTFDRVARSLEGTYRRRFGVQPRGEPAAVVVVYRDAEDYRRLQRREAALGGLPASGHTSGGLVALFSRPDAPEDAVATLIHELTHLLNRRAVGPALPSWLDEGLAEELATCQLLPDGRLVPGTFSGRILQDGERMHFTGGLASLQRLRRATSESRLPPVRQLVETEWRPFVSRGQEAYSHSAAWVRYLLDGEEGRLAQGFRGFLAAVGSGAPATSETLRQHLGRSWQQLDESFRSWLETQFPGRLPGAVADAATEASTANDSSSRHTAPPPA